MGYCDMQAWIDTLEMCSVSNTVYLSPGKLRPSQEDEIQSPLFFPVNNLILQHTDHPPSSPTQLGTQLCIT